MQGINCNTVTGEVSFESTNGKKFIIDEKQFEMCLLGYLLNKLGTKTKGEITVPVLEISFKIKFGIVDPRETAFRKKLNSLKRQ